MNRSKIMLDLFGEESEEENEGKTKRHGEPEFRSENGSKSVDPNQARGSRLHDGRDREQDPLFATTLHAIFGGFDVDQQPACEEEHKAQNQINQEDNVSKDNGSCVKELKPWGISPDGGIETKLKGKAVAPPVVFEIPMLPPLDHPDQRAIFRISNVISIDPEPFDPSTYEEKDLYVTDMYGSKSRIPSANIIRWRKVRNPDGRSSVESNARIVTWSDGSLQLLIGNKPFDVSEQDIKYMQSHLFLRHEEPEKQKAKANRKKKKRTSNNITKAVRGSKLRLHSSDFSGKVSR